MTYQEDTVYLLKECNSGCKMAVENLKAMLDKIGNGKMKQQVEDSIKEHEKIGDKTHELLVKAGETDKKPAAMAEVMAKMKSGFKLAVDSSDSEVADLLIDGCNMGIKSVSRYLNKYSGAEKEVKDMVDDLVKLEQKLMDELRFYLN